MVSNGALKGLRVLDLSRILAGPYATQLLGDMGADIIKVERPGHGDDTRKWGPPFVQGDDGEPLDESAYYLSANRNKRSLALDITSEDDREILKKILKTCDVLVENYKVGGLEKYGLSYDQLREEFPGLVYCSITGFGQTGPNAHRPGYDLMAQGFGGIMSLTGEPEGEPMKVAVGICDVMTGMYASSAILAALHHKRDTGEGQHIDVALVDVQTAWLINEGTNYLLSGQNPVRRGNQHPNIVPYQVFKVVDGHAIIAVGNDRQFEDFCNLIGQDELTMDQRFSTNTARVENRDTLISLLEPILVEWTRDKLLEEMDIRNIPCGPINQLSDVFNSSQVEAREMRISMPFEGAANEQVELIGNPLKFSKTPVTYRKPPPKCGEHTQEILEEFASNSDQTKE